MQDLSPSKPSPTKDYAPLIVAQLNSPLSKLRSKAGEMRAIAFDQSYTYETGPRAATTLMGLRNKAATVLHSRETSPAPS